MKRMIYEGRRPDAPGGAFVSLYLFLYGAVGAVGVFMPAHHIAAGNVYQAVSWAVWGGILFWALRRGQQVHERALAPYLGDDSEPEPARSRPAPAVIRAWEIHPDGRGARPLPDRDSAVPAELWAKAAELAARGLSITRDSVGASGDVYRRWRAELAELGHMESGQLTPAGVSWLASMAAEGTEPAPAPYRPIATHPMPRPGPSSSSSSSDRGGHDRPRQAPNRQGEGGSGTWAPLHAIALTELPDWLWYAGAALLTVWIVIRWLLEQAAIGGYQVAADRAVGVLLAGALLAVAGWLLHLSADTGREDINYGR